MDYMGRTDNDKRAWMLNFVAKLSAPGGLGVYQVSSADLAAISAAVTAFVAALTVVQQPDGRNPGTTAEKNDTRDAAAAVCRQYAKLIKYNGGIDSQAKIDAGIRPPNTVPAEPVECPLSSPVVVPVAATNGAHTLGYKDSIDLSARAKPVGAVDLLLFRTVAETATTDPEAAKFVGKFTKNPMAVTFESSDNGKIATYFARWSSRRGGMSNWSAPASMAIAA
jgi:hypothetical protein